jgi:hypothetical protein
LAKGTQPARPAASGPCKKLRDGVEGPAYAVAQALSLCALALRCHPEPSPPPLRDGGEGPAFAVAQALSLCALFVGAGLAPPVASSSAKFTHHSPLVLHPSPPRSYRQRNTSECALPGHGFSHAESHSRTGISFCEVLRLLCCHSEERVPRRRISPRRLVAQALSLCAFALRVIPLALSALATEPRGTGS